MRGVFVREIDALIVGLPPPPSYKSQTGNSSVFVELSPAGGVCVEALGASSSPCRSGGGSSSRRLSEIGEMIRSSTCSSSLPMTDIAAALSVRARLRLYFTSKFL